MVSRTILCIDTSGSTYTNFKYYQSVNRLISQHEEKTIISWNSSASFVDSKYYFDDQSAFGGTNFDKCLELVALIKSENIYLIVTTDGEIWDEDNCRELMEKTSLLKRIKFVELYFLGDEDRMNLKIITVFEGIPQRLFINNENVASVKATFNFEDINLQDLPSLKATIISKSKYLKPKKLYIILREWESKAINEITKKSTEFFKEPLKKFYDLKNCKDCAKLIKTEYNRFIEEKKKVQSNIQSVLNMLQKKNVYSLQNIKAINPDTEITPTEYSDEEEGIECDIMLDKCHNLCMLIKQLKEPILNENELKKFADYPFRILQHSDLIDKIIKTVEHFKVDYKSFEKLQKPLKSPFTRDFLKGVFIFHDNQNDVKKLLAHNSRSISILFGNENKLPGSHAVWNIVFLYIMAKYHPLWKQYNKLIFDEIKYLAENTYTYISLSSKINPNIKTKLCIALWYCVNVSPIAFPNSSKNILRVIGKDLYTFYADIYNTPDIDLTTLNIWSIWKYFVQNNNNKCINLDLEVIAQYQNYKIINEKIVFFKVENPALYDEIVLPPMKEDVCTFEIVFVKEVDLDEFAHISINLKTCHPYVICPITKKHWKECAISYNVGSESYIRLFRRYCIAYEKYPSSANDLILFHFEKNLLHNKLMIYPFNNFAVSVLNVFENVMKTYKCTEFLTTANKYYLEAIRLKME
ncbi:uncharacterized protein TNCT_455451 [Trichonephila clavata]|uniref:Uncharacterized protein n=1 Tax=Trichonephila clavata TaxID=2740835 RepID=A0A8X6M446_TRICU|nr:uncharacterized protein TNCT_229611 [Trichonephila clavata]GFR32530.1 uncharacterized protein TNCT_455451 [Trichonephila clavata]